MLRNRTFKRKLKNYPILYQSDGKLYISENYGNSFKEILNEPNLIGNNAAMKFKN